VGFRAVAAKALGSLFELAGGITIIYLNITITREYVFKNVFKKLS